MLLFLLILTIAVAGLGAWIGTRIHQERSRERMLVVRLRKSEIYGHIYPELLRAGKRAVETVVLRPEGISLRFLQPVGDTLTCSFEALGFDPMEQVPLYALAQAVAVDLPCLRDEKCYTLVTHRERQPDGTPWDWYEYAISTEYKDELMRSFALERRSET